MTKFTEKDLDRIVENLIEEKDTKTQIGIMSLSVSIKIFMGWIRVEMEEVKKK